VVFRVQLGAFKKPISRSTFADVPDLTVVRTDDGLYKYMSGSYTTFQDAANAKAALNVKGYNGAFITAYKGGKRIPLEKAGATYVRHEPENLTDTSATSADVKNLVEFRVQLGVFKNSPPADFQQRVNNLKGVKTDVTAAGLNRYTLGSTNDFKSISAMRDQAKVMGFEDCFIIAFFKGQQITVPEALELMK
jgi:cell division protein FtsN